MSTMTETPSSMMMTADGKNVLSSSVAVVTSSSSSSSSLFMKEDYVSSSSHQSTSPKEYFYNALALVALGTSIAAFIMIEGGWIVNIVSVICAFLGPVAALQQQRLTDFQNMKYLQQKLRNQVNAFQMENTRLVMENHKLAQCAKRLKEVEHDLRQLAQWEGKNVQTLMEQVEEYRRIQQNVAISLKAKVIQNLMEVVIRSDDDDDFIIDKNEVDGLLTRLKHMDGVDFSEANFHKAISKAGYNVEEVLSEQGGFDLKAVMNVVRNLLDDKAEDKVFVVHTNELLSPRLQVKMERNPLVGFF